MKYLIIFIFLIINTSLFSDEVNLKLEAGDYEFNLNCPQMPKDKQIIKMDAKVEIQNEKIIVRTKNMMGKEITLNVKTTNNKILMFTADFERDSIISFQYIGKKEDSKYTGEFNAFKDSKNALSGTWELIKK